MYEQRTFVFLTQDVLDVTKQMIAEDPGGTYSQELVKDRLLQRLPKGDQIQLTRWYDACHLEVRVLRQVDEGDAA